MSFVPRVHEIYKHFKGDLYQITAIAEHTETGEQLVVYQAMYGEFKIYARPLSMFISRVDREKYPDVEQEFRFALQGPEASRQAVECGAEAEVTTAGGATECVQMQKSETDCAEAQNAKIPECSVEVQETVASSAERQMCEETGAEIEGLDPMLLEFLDSDSYVQKLNILAGLHHRITDEMLTTMAIACDVEIGNGDVEERYESLKGCLMTLEKYECNRLR